MNKTHFLLLEIFLIDNVCRRGDRGRGQSDAHNRCGEIYDIVCTPQHL